MKKKYYVIIIIIILLVFTMLFLLGRNNDSNKNNEVKENIASKSEENLNVNNIEEDNNGDRLQYKILGTYNAKRPEGTEAFVYVFSENSVIFASDAYSDGTYTIEGDKIKITYSVTHSPVDNSPMDFVRDPEELTIEDENTLVNSEGTKFYKTSEKTTFE